MGDRHSIEDMAFVGDAIVRIVREVFKQACIVASVWIVCDALVTVVQVWARLQPPCAP